MGTGKLSRLALPLLDSILLLASWIGREYADHVLLTRTRQSLLGPAAPILVRGRLKLIVPELGGIVFSNHSSYPLTILSRYRHRAVVTAGPLLLLDGELYGSSELHWF